MMILVCAMFGFAAAAIGPAIRHDQELPVSVIGRRRNAHSTLPAQD